LATELEKGHVYDPVDTIRLVKEKRPGSLDGGREGDQTWSLPIDDDFKDTKKWLGKKRGAERPRVFSRKGNSYSA